MYGYITYKHIVSDVCLHCLVLTNLSQCLVYTKLRFYCMSAYEIWYCKFVKFDWVQRIQLTTLKTWVTFIDKFYHRTNLWVNVLYLNHAITDKYFLSIITNISQFMSVNIIDEFFPIRNLQITKVIWI